MIQLIVLFQWQPDVSKEKIKETIRAIEGMKSKIPGILEITAGENIDASGSANKFSHAVVFRFRDRAAFEAYGPHPAHLEVVNDYIKPILQENLCVTCAL